MDKLSVSPVWSANLKLNVGVINTTGKLDLSINDGSVTVTDTSVTNTAGATNVVYTIKFRASAPSKTLTVKWTQNTTSSTGRVSLQSATLVSAADTTSPTTVITDGPIDGSTITDDMPTFDFSSGDGGVSYQCRIDGSTYSTCASPFTTATLGTGAHTFDVRSTDASGNTETRPPRRSFTVQ